MLCARRRSTGSECTHTCKLTAVARCRCCLQAGTYNVAGKKPPPGLLLTEWLDQWRDAWPRSSSSSNSNAAGGADIVAVGFQEVVPLSAGNVIAGPSSAGADAWDYALAATLNGADW